MNVHTFLKNLIATAPEYALSDAEQKTIQFEGIDTFIFNKLTSTKYRCSSLGEDLAGLIKTAIKVNTAARKPIQILLPFGAYKLWKLPTQPYPDWAEVFNIVQMREYLAPIASAYEHGVTLTYFSVELFVERNNHIPQKDLDEYQKEFVKLIQYFQRYLPRNLSIEFKNLREDVSQEKALAAVEKKIVELRKDWDTVSTEEKEQKIKRAKVNCKVEKTDPNYDEIIKEAVHVHDAFSSECWAPEGYSPWDYNDGIISLGHSYTTGWGIHVKSSKSSRVIFWVGIGALEKRDKFYLPTILSYEQFKKMNGIIDFEEIELFGKSFTNLKQIPILHK